LFPVANFLKSVLRQKSSCFQLLLSRHISQRNVATHLMCCGIFSDSIIAHVLRTLTVKWVWKSVNIWWS